jgi:DDE family transposase
LVTQCTQTSFEFQAVGRRDVVAQFNGGTITSDGGVILLSQLESQRHIISQFAACFSDYRDPQLIEHPLADLLAQRIYALALGYEDLNDHDLLRSDPLLATAVGKTDPTGESRRRESDRGKALAGKSTLNRLELRSDDAEKDDPYKKIAVDAAAVAEFFVNVFMQAHEQAPESIIVDLDATDDIVHGKQEGGFYHGYYGNYCYLPLYIFCGDFLLCAKLRQANQDQSAGALDEIKRIVGQLRQDWSEVAILLRGDSGFCRDEIMSWCEANGVDYLFGLAKNARLLALIVKQMQQAQLRYEISGAAARVYAELRYQTRDSWSSERRVVAKAEHLEKGANPRFVVTSLSWWEVEAKKLYEESYCGRGDMENRIKEQQMDLFADRTSTSKMKSNQLRLWLSSVAYVLVNEMRRLALPQTDMAQAQCGSIRRKRLKIGAQVVVSFRRIAVKLSSSYPYQELFARVYRALSELTPLRC